MTNRSQGICRLRPITRMMLDRIIDTLVRSENEAADDVMLEALRLGNEREQSAVMDGLIRRETVRGLGGVIEQYKDLPDSLKLVVLQNIRYFHHALTECGRSQNNDRRVSAIKLIAQGRQGKLCYVLSENLHNQDEDLAHAACEAIVSLARWVSTETRNLQKMTDDQRARTYAELMDNRPEIEQAVARAIDVHRGKYATELLRATLLLCDWAGSKTLGILRTAKHGGQSPMVRRLQQPPASEHVEAFLLGASHGGLRVHFGIVFGHISEAPVLDGLVRKTHWLKDHQLQLCMRQVQRGTWWSEADLKRDIHRRTPEDKIRVAEWIGASGLHDVMQDDRLLDILKSAKDDFGTRLRLLRIAASRPRSASISLFRTLLTDPDERIVRMAAREIVRRKPLDFENMLLQLMTNATDSVRRVVSRCIGQAGFEQFWQRFDRLEKSTRKNAGKAMLKLLPDAVHRLSRRLVAGPIQQRLKALQIAHELELSEQLKPVLIQLCSDANPKLRSKAVFVLGELPSTPTDLLLERVLNDSDARVRANAIEVLEAKQKREYLPLLTTRARNATNRERANAIKALHRMKVGTATNQLLMMLADERPEHRISALWTLRQIGVWQMLSEVGRMAKGDTNLKVRRYAMGVLRGVAEMIQAEKLKKTGS